MLAAFFAIRKESVKRTRWTSGRWDEIITPLNILVIEKIDIITIKSLGVVRLVV